jgi:cell division protein FtsQ
MKTRVILPVVAVGIFIALICLVIFSPTRSEKELCRKLIVVIKDSTERSFLREADIVRLLKNHKQYPVDKPLDHVNTEKIEQLIRDNELVSTADVYKTPSGNVKIEITQRHPILRVFANGETYFVDNQGVIMPANYRYATRLPVASGNIEKSLATHQLYDFALFLQQNEFWNHLIEQIYVHPDDDVELITRVGDFKIILGSFDDYEEKMDNLKLFYQQAIPKVGWDKYSTINLKYKNQIVCTKKNSTYYGNPTLRRSN